MNIRIVDWRADVGYTESEFAIYGSLNAAGGSRLAAGETDRNIRRY